MPERAIHALDRGTASLLRSSVVIPSFESIAAHLVRNSLDADATQVDVAVDWTTWSITCTDNGRGIPASDLSQLERYSSTTAQSGEALASINDLAWVQIVSRDHRSTETYHLVKRRRVTLEFAAAKERTRPGTTVAVRDIFHNYPVRRKQLATAASQLSTVNRIRSHLSTVSLVRPAASFSLTDATDAHRPKTSLAVSKTPDGVLGRWKQLWGRAGVERVWHFDRETNTSDGQRTRARGFISDSASHGKSHQFILVNGVPLAPQSSTLYKLVNRVFAASSFSRHASSLLSHPAVSSPSRSRTSSPVVVNESSPEPRSAPRRKTPKQTVEKHPIFVVELEVDRSQRGVSGDGRDYTNFEDDVAIEVLVEAIVKEFLVAKGFSPTPHISTTRQVRPGFDQDGDVDDMKRDEEPCDWNPRIRDGSHRGQDIVPEPPRKKIKMTTAAAAGLPAAVAVPIEFERLRDVDSCTRTRLVDRTALARKTRASLETDPRRRGPAESEREVGGREGTAAPMPEWLRETLTRWENPIFTAPNPTSTVQIPSLDASRLPRSSHLLVDASTGTPRPRQMFPSSKPSVLVRSKPSSGKLTQSRLAHVSNFFSSASARLATPRVRAIQNGSTRDHSDSSDRGDPSRGRREGSQTFSRESIERAEFVAQVDDKYLLVKIPPPADPRRRLDRASLTADGGEQQTPLECAALVMFDQHAVSERIRVERFLEQVCRGRGRIETINVAAAADDGGGTATTGTTRATGIIVSREEHRELGDALDAFAEWGIAFSPASFATVSSSDDRRSGVVGGRERCEPARREVDYVQVWVETAPKVVGQRLVQDPKLLQEVVRGYLAQLREHPFVRSRGPSDHRSTTKTTRHDSDDDGDWVGKVKDCPVGLVELINSKACRGAVMFNDRLSDEQAREMLRALAETKFPFTCAHGRPSIVPLVNLAAEPRLPAGPFAGSPESPRSREIDWTRLT